MLQNHYAVKADNCCREGEALQRFKADRDSPRRQSTQTVTF